MMRDRDYPYFSAIAVVILAFLIRLGLDPWLNERSPFLAFAVAIIIAAGRYGTGPGLVATILSLLIGTFAFIAPHGAAALTADEVTNLGLFISASVVMLVFAAHLKASNERAIQLQADLQEAQAETAMGAMAATLAHELNQPLAAASNYLAACKRIVARTDQPDKARLIKGLTEAEAQIHRTGKIIRHARQLVTNKASERQQVSLRETASRVVEPLRASATCQNARLRLEIEPEADKLHVNPTQIEQVLMNLMRNACQAVNGAGPSVIEVSARVVDQSTVIEVRDHGPGIPEEQLKALFTTPIKSTSGGLGLGLSICRTIIEAHGGRIGAANHPKGGARFFFTVPRTNGES